MFGGRSCGIECILRIACCCAALCAPVCKGGPGGACFTGVSRNAISSGWLKSVSSRFPPNSSSSSMLPYDCALDTRVLAEFCCGGFAAADSVGASFLIGAKSG